MNDIPINPEVEDFVGKVLAKFLAEITDRIFLMIKGDPAMKSEYNHLLSALGEKTVNPQIGKLIKEKLDLGNSGRARDPESGLIDSYTRHKLK